jgi:hypothetical protein
LLIDDSLYKAGSNSSNMIYIPTFTVKNLYNDKVMLELVNYLRFLQKKQPNDVRDFIDDFPCYMRTGKVLDVQKDDEEGEETTAERLIVQPLFTNVTEWSKKCPWMFPDIRPNRHDNQA